MKELIKFQNPNLVKALQRVCLPMLLICFLSTTFYAQSGYFKSRKLNTSHTYYIVAKHSKKVFDVANSKNGTAIIQYTKHGGKNQQFQLVDRGNGYYSLKSVSSGKGIGIGASSKLVLSTLGTSANQQFKLIDKGNGYCEIQVKGSGKLLDVAGSSKKNGGAILQYGRTNNANQLFQFLHASGGTASIYNEKYVPIAAKDFEVKMKIKCVEENDGGGDAEEIFGKVYVSANFKNQHVIWQKDEDAFVSIDEGKTHNVSKVVLLKDLDLSAKITLGGHLYEEDTGGDDDLGSQKKVYTLEQMLAGPKSVRFTHDDTKIDVIFTITRPKGKYITLEKIRCIVPSKGTDTATEAAVGIGIGIGSIVGGIGVGMVNPGLGANIVVKGVIFATQAKDIVGLYNKVHKGSDDLYIQIDGHRVWPNDEYMSMKSQQTKRIGKTWRFNSAFEFELMEYDSGSDDDDMGSWKFKKDLPLSNESTTLIINHKEEASTYEVTYKIVQY